jgi:lipopolysaccharide transport system ATP-binding protein
MNNDTVIQIRDVSKKYCKTLKKSMLYGALDISRDIFGLSSHPENLRADEFWALDNLSFSVKRGECRGLIGPNGSGKSTLLKMLNGIILPDKGEISITGKVGALIELGAGFHPMLTGRENIYVNGNILGLTKKEIDKKFEEIVEFSEIKEFIDTPVKFYSSGMYVRLGFSIAAHLMPDILVIDEVLAVGDVAFRLKCFNHIQTLLKKKISVILVTHNLSELLRVCQSCVVINHGRQLYNGDVHEAIRTYQNIMYNSDIPSVKQKSEFKFLRIKDVQTLNSKHTESNEFRSGDDILLRITYEGKITSDNCTVIIKLASQESGPFASFSNHVSEQKIPIRPGETHIYVKLLNLPLLAGNYAVEVHIYNANKTDFWDQAVPACTFNIIEPIPEIWKEYHTVRIKHEWILEGNE